MLTEVQISAVYEKLEAELGMLLDEGSKELIKLGMKYLDRNDPSNTLFRQTTVAAMKKLEAKSKAFSLESKQFQLTIATEDKFSQLKIRRDDLGIFTVTATKNLLERKVSTEDVPNVRAVIANLHACKKPVFAFFGGVGKAEPKAIIQLSNRMVDKLIEMYGYIAVLNAGYRGYMDDQYGGIVRAAHDSSSLRSQKAISLVIIPEVGVSDCHTHPTAIDIYGGTWGDDTPALTGIPDSGVVCAPYGLITELEIASTQQNDKPIVIINTEQEAASLQITEALCGYRYKKPVYSFNTVDAAMAYLEQELGRVNFDKEMALDENCQEYFGTRNSRTSSPYHYNFHNGAWVTGGWEEFSAQFKTNGNLKTPPRYGTARSKSAHTSPQGLSTVDNRSTHTSPQGFSTAVLSTYHLERSRARVLSYDGETSGVQSEQEILLFQRLDIRDAMQAPHDVAQKIIATQQQPDLPRKIVQTMKN